MKRVTFRGVLLPLLLLAPQLAITCVFFIWPASRALWQSLLQEDPFGLRTSFVWLDNFERVLSDPGYLHSLQVTLVFSVAVTVSGLAIALLLAVMADRVIKGAGAYKTVLIWP
jgi:sn-glycerol 3-phosphate transport system permease protein